MVKTAETWLVLAAVRSYLPNLQSINKYPACPSDTCIEGSSPLHMDKVEQSVLPVAKQTPTSGRHHAKKVLGSVQRGAEISVNVHPVAASGKNTPERVLGRFFTKPESYGGLDRPVAVKLAFYAPIQFHS
jgi:hypothetical protein